MALPEEKFDNDVWHVLKKIKERSLYTEAGKPISYFVISEPSDFFNPQISPDNEIAVLRKLNEQGVIKLTNPDSVDLARPDVYIEIIQPAFEQLYEFHKIFTDRQSKKEGQIDNKKGVELKTLKIEFDDDEATLKVGKQNVALPPYKNEHFFCQVVFEYKPKEPISWDIIYDKMTGHSAISGGEKPEPDRKNWQKVNDTMKRLNNRIKEVAKTNEDLFIWREKMVIRSY